MEDESIPICSHCWIPVVKQAEMKGVIGTEEMIAPKWIHTRTRNDVGNPFCGRQFLEDEDIEWTFAATEA